MRKILAKIRELTKIQKIMICSCVALALVAVGAGALFYNYQVQKRKEALEAQKKEEEVPIIMIEEPEEEVVQEVLQEVVQKPISFSGTSIAKDLKIKIVDENSKLVSGAAFVITVTAEGDTTGKEYNDHDQDGIIYIKNMKPGEYTVQLHDIEGFAIAENSISVKVKDKIEYKKVDVTNEIKQASEVDIQKEDAPVQRPKEESNIENTVEFFETTKIEVAVKKENVDLSNFPQASVSETKKQENLADMATVAVSEAVTLYNQGGEQSKRCILKVEIVDENQIVQGFTWQAEQEGIFTFEENEDKSITISALQTGLANLCINIGYKTDSVAEEQSKTMQIAVTVFDVTDDKTQLKDTKGESLYLDKDAKQPATLKDYSVTESFYSAPKYTGWQTINGKRYYYDNNHKVVTGVQIIGGVRYTFGEDGALLKTKEMCGIDVSKWQKTIDWNAVANAGIDFAIIRAGNRGSSTGALIEDPYFKENIKGATKAGIKVGVYVYSQAITEAEAIEEASMALSLVKGYRLQLPIYFDTEFISGGRANNLSVSARTAIAKAFCETVRNAGYMPGIYSNYYWLRDNLKMSQLEMYSVWVAHYAKQCGYPGRYDMWQYTSSGSVPGISGRVDLNISYVGY